MCVGKERITYELIYLLSQHECREIRDGVIAFEDRGVENGKN